MGAFLRERLAIPVPDDVTERAIADCLQVPGVKLEEGRKQVWGYFDGLEAAAKILGVDRTHITKARIDGQFRGVKFTELPKARFEQVKTALRFREYQEKGVADAFAKVRACGGVLLADDMGLGKTRQALGLAFLCGSFGRVFVVCPASVSAQWGVEAGQLYKPEEICVVTSANSGTKKTRAKFAAAKIVITSYGMVEKVFSMFGTEMPFVAVFDEAQNLLGRRSARSLAVHEASRFIQYRIATTGTPMWSRPRNLWMLLNILVGSRFGKAYDFDLRYCGGEQKEHGFDNKGQSNPDELKERLAHYMVRRTKSEVLGELPALTRTIRWVEGTHAAAGAFQQAILHPGVGGLVDAALRATLEAKIPLAVETCLEAGGALCLTYLREHVAAIAEGIRKGGGEVIELTGDVAPAMRSALVIGARSKPGVSIVATIDSVGTGVDGIQHLTRTGVMHAIDRIPAKLMQAEARLHRMGQANAVHWTYLAMKDSMDEKVVRVVVQRLETWKRMIPNTKGDGTQELRDSMSDQFGSEMDAKVLAALFEETETGGDDGGE